VRSAPGAFGTQGAVRDIQPDWQPAIFSRCRRYSPTDLFGGDRQRSYNEQKIELRQSTVKVDDPNRMQAIADVME
jgi:hypothetical protein